MVFLTAALIDIVEAAATPAVGDLMYAEICHPDDSEIQKTAIPNSGTTPDEAARTIMEVRGKKSRRRRMIPKRLDLKLEFKNLTYIMRKSVKERCECWSTNKDRIRSEIGNQKNVLLHNISGVVRGGEILAVMGSSGSGKSTLIDALAQRIANHSLQGSITLNGEEVKHNIGLMRSISAYVMQDDLLFPMLTVKETLRFAAELRLPSSSAEKSSRVREVIKQLNLSKVEDTIIGDEGHRGVSGGERRRVSIGKEIVHDPLLLFLDEPTSGLDSANAYTVVETLLEIAQTGSIVMLSVHQPSMRILKLVTTLLLIADGRTIYCGPPRGMKDFFGTIGYEFNEGDVTESVLDLMQEFHKAQVPVTGLVEEFQNYAAKLENEAAAIDNNIESVIGCDASSSSEPDPESLLPTGVRGALAASIARGKLVGSHAYRKQYDDMDTLVHKFANSWAREVYVLAWRGALNLKRTPDLFLMRLVTVTVSGVFLATIFWRLDHSPQGLKERLGFFAFAISTTYYTCVDTLPIFLQERYIFMRETAHDSYRISSYVFAIGLINIPFLLLLSFTFSIATFWSVGLTGGLDGFLFFLVVVWASFWAGNSFATFLSAVISNVIMGYTIVVAVLAYFLLLSGFFISRSRIPTYWLWFHYLSLIKYPYEAVLLNEFDRSSSECYETADQIFYGTPFAGSEAISSYVLAQMRTLLRGTVYSDLNASTCMVHGSAVLRSQSVGGLSKWECLGLTVCFGLLYRLLFYAVLRISGKVKRH
ncbi:ATP-binding cassette, subfamily G (WHITE), member 2 [Marchantia polymorpha subsp. ruderalis]|uniref:ABC transporter domain-containing protein n=2 Tax=Marchantia polymorpha TaxID=3197 RepID=A0AAF6BVW8_MARPO|nr:hypothetical protein MARPO_0526s0002 [Marchantia polymorpha]BBN16152.1 hypothetical protein Mp_7g03860 [Marchantia polymorpha subsp. ruderalis]|eukprot:PTQ26718.1 hypothetical protein MARPO_0526s0002 [Marchantia polymorpha]